MPRGPQGQHRPQSEVQAAVMVGKIATSQIKEPQMRRLFVLEYGMFPSHPKSSQKTSDREPLTN